MLGAADVPDEVLAELVGRLLHVAPAARVELVASTAEEVAYDLDALTTAGRWWVRGTAQVDGQARHFAVFVKVVQSWARSPAFAFVPEHLRDVALAGLRWQREPAVYRSDLRSRLPAGLTMPECVGVVDLDEDSAALWLEAVDCVAEPWDLPRFERAAYLLGRLAADPQVNAAAVTREDPGRVRAYAEGRVAHQVLPLLHSDVWSHPLVAPAFGAPLRARVLTAADALPAVLDELDALPTAALHGDACTRNLLVPRTGEDFVLIDFGFWGAGPVGFDLGQLLVGEVQVGERAVSWLPVLEDACVRAYTAGLADEVLDLDEAVVRRAHALQLLLFTGLSALPFEHLDAEPTPALQELACSRAALTEFVLDLVDATS